MSPEENMDMNSTNVLVSFFGQHHQGRPVLEIVVRISLTALVAYPGEKDLQVPIKLFFHHIFLSTCNSSGLMLVFIYQALTCRQLLHSLVRQKHVCVHLVTLVSHYASFAVHYRILHF